MSKKHKKFNKIWSNQTDIGKKFGISSVAVGKILIEAGLKDPITKHATKHALGNGFAKATPLKDGTPYFMWSISKVRDLISKTHQPISKVDYWVNEVKLILKEADKLVDEGSEKLGYMMADDAYYEVPKEILKEVEEKILENKLC